MSVSMTCPVSRSITLNRGDPEAREPRCCRIVNPSFRAWDRRCGVGAVELSSTEFVLHPCFVRVDEACLNPRNPVTSVGGYCLTAAEHSTTRSRPVEGQAQVGWALRGRAQAGRCVPVACRRTGVSVSAIHAASSRTNPSEMTKAMPADRRQERDQVAGSRDRRRGPTDDLAGRGQRRVGRGVRVALRLDPDRPLADHDPDHPVGEDRPGRDRCAGSRRRRRRASAGRRVRRRSPSRGRSPAPSSPRRRRASSARSSAGPARARS